MRFRLFSAAILVLVWGCGSPFETAGGSTDTGNTIVAFAGNVLDEAGTPAGKSDLSIRRSDYLSPLPSLLKQGRATLDTVTDEAGAFLIQGMDTGDYRVEVRKGNNWAAILDLKAKAANKPLELEEKYLQPITKVSGTLLLNPNTSRAFVQVYGLERLVSINTATGRFEVLLPAGTFQLRFIDPDAGASAILLKAVTTKPGDSLDLGTLTLKDPALPYAAWTRSNRIWINTGDDGAQVKEDVYDFPLLVRLDASSFDFTQANPNGSDIRFLKSNGKTPLAYEIERWDAKANQAEIWVRLDTVRGDTPDQLIHLVWGNPDAGAVSNGGTVFDTALGYRGVWHLKEASNESGFNGYHDATYHANTGAGSSIADTTARPSQIGIGQRLSGIGAHIRVPNTPSLNLGTGDFCFSVWARADAISRTHNLISKRVSAGGNYEFQVLANGHVESFVGSGTGNENFSSRNAIGINEWHYLALRRKGTETSLYIDGILDTLLSNTGFNLDNTSDLFIGHDALGFNEDWQGTLDEVRLSQKASPPEWLLLSYRNQMAGSKMISLNFP